jgi:hypothetical protein
MYNKKKKVTNGSILNGCSWGLTDHKTGGFYPLFKPFPLVFALFPKNTSFNFPPFHRRFSPLLKKCTKSVQKNMAVKRANPIFVTVNLK